VPSVAATSLIQRARRFVGDWPDQDVTTASAASGGATLTVASASIYHVNQILQVGTEALRVTAASGTSVTVRRGMFGTTAAAIASGASIMLSPRFLDIEYLDALSAGIDNAWPLLWRAYEDETLTADSTTYEYTVPAMASDSTVYPHISEVWVRTQTTDPWQRFRQWRIRYTAAGVPELLLRAPIDTGTSIMLKGFGPFPRLDEFTDTTDAQFPRQAEWPLIEYAASWLLESGEIRRTAIDRGVIDNREQANRVGASLQVSSALLQRYLRKLEGIQPPVSGYPHVITAI